MPDEPGPGPGALEALEVLGDAELRARVEALRETIRCGPPRPRRPRGGEADSAGPGAQAGDGGA